MPDPERVCVVAGAGAWPFYLATAAWVGQENRRFGGATRLGFYSGRQIQGLVPRIQHVVPSVDLTGEAAAALALSGDPAQRRVGGALAAALHDGTRADRVQVVLLSGAQESDTATIEPLRHDGDAAWTLFQRFADLDLLRRAGSTDDLGGA